MNDYANITVNINSILMLNGSNFKSLKENILILLSVINFDLALKVGSPPPLKDQSTSENKREIKRWERSNCMSTSRMITRKAISKAYWDTISEKIITIKELLMDIEIRFAKNEKVEIGTISMKYKDKGLKRKKDEEVAYTGHIKKHYVNYHTLHAKKARLLNLFCPEVNLTLVPKHTWWIGSDVITHFSMFMQGCLNC
ncbi:hypothetical protein CR513_20572, partial [Mucuna pruriens]